MPSGTETVYDRIARLEDEVAALAHEITALKTEASLLRHDVDIIRMAIKSKITRYEIKRIKGGDDTGPHHH